MGDGFVIVYFGCVWGFYFCVVFVFIEFFNIINFVGWYNWGDFFREGWEFGWFYYMNLKFWVILLGMYVLISILELFNLVVILVFFVYILNWYVFVCWRYWNF